MLSFRFIESKNAIEIECDNKGIARAPGGTRPSDTPSQSYSLANSSVGRGRAIEKLKGFGSDDLLSSLKLGHYRLASGT